MTRLRQTLNAAVVAALTLIAAPSIAQHDLHKYEVKFRLNGKVSYEYPMARTAAEAKQIVKAGCSACQVLEAKRVD